MPEILAHLDRDLLRHDRRVVRDVALIAEQQLQRVRARSQLELDLGLPAAEMAMILVRRNRDVEIRQARIDQKMVMPSGFELDRPTRPLK